MILKPSKNWEEIDQQYHLPPTHPLITIHATLTSKASFHLHGSLIGSNDRYAICLGRAGEPKRLVGDSQHLLNQKPVFFKGCGKTFNNTLTYQLKSVEFVFFVFFPGDGERGASNRSFSLLFCNQFFWYVMLPLVLQSYPVRLCV